MARPPKRKVPGKGSGAKAASGRVTPKGGSDRQQADASSRYTPPVPKQYRQSPMWVPVLMFVFLGLGALTIFFNYLGLLPGATSNWYLLVGLGFILAGIVTATNFH
jgi:Cell division protein CrgA